MHIFSSVEDVLNCLMDILSLCKFANCHVVGFIALHYFELDRKCVNYRELQLNTGIIFNVAFRTEFKPDRKRLCASL